MSPTQATHRSSTPATEEQSDYWLRDLAFGRELKTAFDEIIQACPKYTSLIVYTFYLLIRPQVSHPNSWEGQSPSASFHPDHQFLTLFIGLVVWCRQIQSHQCNLWGQIHGRLQRSCAQRYRYFADFELQTVEDGREAGKCDIEKEFTSKQNPRLILHDSQGFSHGSGANFNIVKEFIKERSQRENIRDRLHAIWFDGLFGSFCTELLIESGKAVFRSARIRRKFARSW